jgi:hypothetical protein
MAMTSWLRGSIALPLALALMATAARGAAPEAERNLVPVPFNVNTVADARTSIDREAGRIGEMVQICFHVSAPGYVTLWDIGTDGSVSRIFPNAYSGSSAAAEQIGDVNEHCAGKEADPFRFQIAGPTGIEDVYTLWTASADLQPKSATFASASEFAEALKYLQGVPRDKWVAVKTSLDVLEAAAPQAPPAQPNDQTPPQAPPARPNDQAPPQTDTGDGPAASGLGKHVYVFAAGANVKPLTKSNQDAGMIVNTLQKTFGIPSGNLKLVENVKKPQFKAAMAWLAEVTQPDDIVFVYFSGHGTPVRDRTGTTPDGIEEAFVPYEFNDESAHYADLILNHELVHWTNAIRARRIIVLADSCYSGGMLRDLPTVTLGLKPKFFVPWPALVREAEEAADRELRDLAAAKAVRETPRAVLFAAAQRNQTASETSRGSLFTLELVDVVTKAREIAEKEKVSLAEVFAVATKWVEDASKQQQSPAISGAKEVAADVLLPSGTAAP